MKATTQKLGYGDYLRFRDLVLRRSGLYFPEKKRSDIEIGLFKALEKSPQFNGDIDAYYRFLDHASSPAARTEMDRLINLLTIGETHFFRDSSQFDALIHHIFPAIIARKRAAAMAASTEPTAFPKLRIWSAGCASGEEAYSLAILLRELIPDISFWRVLILATDINDDSLDRAREAIYSDWSFRETRALSLRSVYFNREEKRYRLRDDIRQMVTFARHNLMEDDIPALHNNTASMDLIICRNVTIYFAEETTRTLVKKFYDSLVDNGWLVVGHSEPSLLIYRDYQAHTFPGTLLYQKTGRPSTIPDDWNMLDKAPTSQPSPATPPPQATITYPKLEPTNKTEFRRMLQTKPLPPRRTGFPDQPDISPPRRTGFLPAFESNGTQILEADPYQAARRLLSQGQISRAILTLEGSIDIFSAGQRPYAYCLLARAYADKGHWEEARHWCESAIKLNTLLPESYAILAMIDEHEGEIDKAIANLKKVIYLDRERPLSHFSLAMLYRKKGQNDQFQRALKNVEKILARWPAKKIIPDSGGTSARRLLNSVQQMLAEVTNRE